jgi:hypothetical protein
MRPLLLLAVLLLALLAFPPASKAGSPSNPYRSFNISGINYGAQVWDREHGVSQPKSRGARFFWRWR